MTSIKDLEKEKEQLIKAKEESNKKKQLEKEIRILKHGDLMKAVKATTEGLRVVGESLIGAGKKIGKAGQQIGENTLQQMEKDRKKREAKESNEQKEPREDVLDTMLRI